MLEQDTLLLRFYASYQGRGRTRRIIYTAAAPHCGAIPTANDPLRPGGVSKRKQKAQLCKLGFLFSCAAFVQAIYGAFAAVNSS